MWRSWVWLGVLLSSGQAAAGTPYASVGSEPDAAALREYRSEAIQSVRQHGKWVPRARVSERLQRVVTAGRPALQHTQFTATGAATEKTVAVLDPDTLVLRQLHQEIAHESTGRSRIRRIQIDSERYHGMLEEGEHREPIAGTIDGPVYYGTALGLVLAALPLAEEYVVELPVFVPQIEATYRVTARVTGRENYDFAGEAVEAWRIETDWLDLERNELARGGEAGNGGLYLIAVDAAAEVPPVLRYINATARLEARRAHNER